MDQYYEKNMGTYYFKKPTTIELSNDILYAADEIAIAYSFFGEEAILLKHGSIELVNNWIKQTRNKYIECGMQDEAEALCMISSTEWDVRDLNKIIDTTGYLTKFLKDHNL